jgi:tripartite-type tricarboxylate transporter receptor subunit TctC
MRIRNLRLVPVVVVAGLILVAFGSPVQAADYPNKPIQFIVPYAAGGATDLWARAIAQVAPRFFLVPVVVVNKAGGGAIPGRLDVVKSRPDGYTLLMGWGSGEDLVVPHQRQLPYDTFTDLVPVCRSSVHSIVMVVPANGPYKDLAEFVKWAKTKEYVTSAVSTKGGSPDITMQLFAKAAGFKMTSVPGSGGADSMTRLAGGHVDFSGAHPSEILPHVKASRIRALAVAFEKRDPSVADIPTFKEQGYDVVTAGSVKGVAVPKGTPKEVIAYLEKKFKDISEDAEFNKIMKDLAQPVMYQGGEEYMVWAKQASEQYAQLIKTLGIDTK